MADKELRQYPVDAVREVAEALIKGGTLAVDNSGQRACMGRKYCTKCNRYEKTRGGGDIEHTVNCVVTTAKKLIFGAY